MSRRRRGRGRAASPTPPPPVSDSAEESLIATDTPGGLFAGRIAVREADAYRASLLRRTAVGVLCAKLAAVTLVFDPNSFNVFAQPKTLVSNAFDFVLLGLMAALALYHARAMVRR